MPIPAARTDALQELKVAAGLAPNDTDVHWRLGRLYRTMGRKDEAKAEFDKASSLHKAENDAVLNKMSLHPHAPEGPETSTTPAGKQP